MKTHGNVYVKFCAAVKDTKLQMLLRGQNLLGYRNYADDVVRLFVENLYKTESTLFVYSML